MTDRLTVAIHKLTSCSGCQLSVINQGPDLLRLLDFIEFKHFIEAGLYAPDEAVDVALVEGSVTTHADLRRLTQARQRSRYLITMGACATSGGVQALRNMADGEAWKQAVYAQPDFVASLSTSTPVAEHVKVDFELWGCPVTRQQLAALFQQLRHGVLPEDDAEKLCMACKRAQTVCVMITQQKPCLGPVVRTGCGALCPAFGRACYGCFGPSEQPNCDAIANRFAGLGLMPETIAQRFAAIHSYSDSNRTQTQRWQAINVRNMP